MLITGYFMCKSTISAKKFAKLVLAVLFWRFLIHAIFWISGYSEFSIKKLIKCLLLITDIGVGFTQSYIMFFLFIPFINILVRNLSQKQHVLLLLLSLFVYTVLGTFKFVFSVNMNYVSWFFVLYLLSSYVRMYPNRWCDKTRLWGWMSALFLSISAASVVVCAMCDKDGYYFVEDSNTFLALATAFSAFMFFKNVKIRYSPFINGVAATCFGVLLIHAHSDAMRQWLWRDLLHNAEMYNSSWIYVHSIASAIGVFVVCSAMEFVRLQIVEKPFFKLWDKKYDGIEAKLKRLSGGIINRIKNAE